MTGVGIGTAIVSYIEPERGYMRAFNDWYERDHFVATVRAGPGVFASGRFVATPACIAARRGTLWGDPARGSYLSVAWVLPGKQAEWDAWVSREMEVITAQGRLFPHREHVHTGVYRYVDERGSVPAMFAFDRAPAGVIAIAHGNDEGIDVPGASTIVTLQSERTIVSSADPAPHRLVFAFAERDPLSLRLVSRDDVGFVSPFLSTVPGSDAYTEERA